MRLRVLTAAVGIPLFLLLDFAGQGEALAVATAVVAALGIAEYARTATGGRLEWPIPLAMAAALLFCADAWWQERLPALAVSAGLTLLLLAGLAGELFRRPLQPARHLGAAVVAAVYVGWLLCFVIRLRRLTAMAEVPPFIEAQPFAPWAVLTVFVVTWATDTGAYLVGRRCGTRRLAPTISPGKTQEGFLGGLAGAVLVALAMGLWTGLGHLRELQGTIALHSLLLGLLLGTMGQVGDLCASALKREAGVKDFGGLLPGHGGILDRFDSLLFNAPLGYYYLTLVVGLR